MGELAAALWRAALLAARLALLLVHALISSIVQNAAGLSRGVAADWARLRERDD